MDGKLRYCGSMGRGKQAVKRRKEDEDVREMSSNAKPPVSTPPKLPKARMGREDAEESWLSRRWPADRQTERKGRACRGRVQKRRSDGPKERGGDNKHITACCS